MAGMQAASPRGASMGPNSRAAKLAEFQSFMSQASTAIDKQRKTTAGGRHLSDEELLGITREIGFAESAFIYGLQPDGSVRVRIFTPEYEVPFAGTQ